MEGLNVLDTTYHDAGWSLAHHYEHIIGELGESLALLGAHRPSCATQYGEECDCGYRLALETAIAFRSKDQTEEADEPNL